MADTLEWKPGTKTRSRKIPLLPRFGIVIDWGGQRLTYKHSPILETLWNMIDHGVGLSGFRKAAREELGEIPIRDKDNPYADGPAAKAASRAFRKGAKAKPASKHEKPPRRTKTTAKKKTAAKRKAARNRQPKS